MGSASHAAATESALPALRWKLWLRRYFYLVMLLVAAVVLFWGFGHTIGPVMLHPDVPRPRILWAHAFVFSAWILLSIVQSGLVRIHRVAIHRLLGWAMLGLAAAMVVAGVITAIQLGHFDLTVLHQPGADTFEIVSYADMMLFPLLVGLAVVYRRKPELHRRLLLLSTLELTGAGFGRIDWIAAHNLMFFCADTLMCLGIFRDLIVDGRVNKVYKIGIPAIVVWHVWVTWMYLHPPAWWAHLAHVLMG